VPLSVQDRVQYWFTAPPGRLAADCFPVWIWQLADGTAAYGAPASASGVKAAIHHSPVRPAGDWSADEVHALLRPLLPGLGALARSARCTYTMTPDEHAVVGRHPQHDRVLVACGFSGHGFKLTPVLGEALADLAVEGVTRHGLELLDPLRKVVPGRLTEVSPTG
jgi:sarcosine oxidase